MPTPVALLQFWVVVLHVVGRTTLHTSHHITDSKWGRDRHHQMDVITRDNPFDNLDAQFFVNLPDNIAYSHPKLAFEHLIAILGNPDDVIVIIENGVRAGIVGHTHLFALSTIVPVIWISICVPTLAGVANVGTRMAV